MSALAPLDPLAPWAPAAALEDWLGAGADDVLGAALVAGLEVASEDEPVAAESEEEVEAAESEVELEVAASEEDLDSSLEDVLEAEFEFELESEPEFEDEDEDERKGMPEGRLSSLLPGERYMLAQAWLSCCMVETMAWFCSEPAMQNPHTFILLRLCGRRQCLILTDCRTRLGARRDFLSRG